MLNLSYSLLRSDQRMRAGIVSMLLLLLMQFASTAMAAALQIELRSEAVVAGRQVSIANVAAVHSTEPALAEQVKALKLGSTPRVGYAEQLTREDINQVIRRRIGNVKDDVSWSGAQTVKVRALSQTIDTKELAEVARKRALAQLQERFSDVDVQALAIAPELELPIGDIRLQPQALDVKQIHARMPLRVDVLVDGETYRTVVVPLSVVVRREVYVAKQDLMEGAAATTKDFELKSAETSGAVDEYVARSSISGTFRLRKKLSAGQLLTTSHLAAEDRVLRGDVVKLVLAEGGVMIETRAVAQQEGSLGQSVRVKPENSTDAITARVIAMGVVQAGGR